MSKEFEFNPEKNEDSQNEGEVNKPKIQPKNVDDINPNIDVITKPVVVLFGPTQVGKTTVLMRMLKYFEKSGKNSFKINEQFITDAYFEDIRDGFMENFRKQNKKADATVGFNFLLLDINDNSEPFCHILEGPGEHFFSLENMHESTFKNYLFRIFNSLNQQKVFIIFFEEKFLDREEVRSAYAKRVASVLKQLGKNDSAIFLFNKIDESPDLTVGGEIKSSVLKDKIYKNPSYSPILQAVKANKNIKSISFVPFSCGSEGDNGTFAFGNDKYPERLWRTIVNAIIPEGCRWW